MLITELCKTYRDSYCTNIKCKGISINTIY